MKGKALKLSGNAAAAVRRGVDSGSIQCEYFVLAEAQRLDLVAANFYGNPSYWWVIAAASGIGWQCQVPPGTYLKIPTDITQIETILK